MSLNKKKLLVSVLVFLIGELAIFALDQIILDNRLIFDRFLLLSTFPFIISLHFYFDIKKLWDFFFMKRYIIGTITFIFIVVNGYHGSSISVYEHAIQPSVVNEENMPFLGTYRAIRSDEFLVDTPSIFSQVESNENLSDVNSSLMANESLVTLFPALPTKTLAVLLKPHYMGYLFLPLEQAFSFAWFLPYFAMFFGLFELFRYITKDKKGYSLFGSILLTLSPGILWWGIPQIFIYGILATICFKKFLDAKNWKLKLLFSMLLGWMGACYVATVYPAWMIPYGYLFLIFFIWLWVKNKKAGVWKHIYFLYLIPMILVMAVLLVPVFIENLSIIEMMGNTVYPGARVSTGGDAWQWLYHYIPSILYSVKDVSNASEFSQVISLYPLPILLGTYQAFKNFKNKNNDLLLNLLLVVAIGLTVWNYIDISIFAKLSLLSMSTTSRAQLIPSIACVFILVIMLSNYSQKYSFNIKNVIFSVLLSLITVFIGIEACKVYLPEFMNLKVVLITGSLFAVIMYLFIRNKDKTNILFMAILSCVLIFQGLTVNPLTKGIGALYDKPLFQEIRKILEDDKDSVWMSADSPLHMQSAMIANGAKVLNSTNFHPNFDFWYKLDEKKQFEDIYNRYSHVIINIVQTDTQMTLVTPDAIQVNLSYKDIAKLNVKYIVSTSNEYEGLNTNDLQFQKIYDYDNTYIYKLIY